MRKKKTVGSVMSVDRGFKSSVQFPDVRTTQTYEGLIAVGGRADVGTLFHAYSRGIFPWPQDGYPMLWFFPEERGILFFKDLRINKTLRRSLKKVSENSWCITFNNAFPKVISECQNQPRPGQEGTWITDELKKAYEQFFIAGFVVSCEVWEGEELIGGVYAVKVGNFVSAESMFFKKSNASKVALIYLIEKLKTEGLHWIDIQMVTPVTEALGGQYISKKKFIELFEA